MHMSFAGRNVQVNLLIKNLILTMIYEDKGTMIYHSHSREELKAVPLEVKENGEVAENKEDHV